MERLGEAAEFGVVVCPAFSFASWAELRYQSSWKVDLERQASDYQA